METKLKTFSELTADELYQILQLRSEVFVVEQECPYQDIDGRDKDSWHFYFLENDEILAYCRILPAGQTFKEASIGRVLVREKARKRGLAHQMMKKVLQNMPFNAPAISIEAQFYLREFYKSFGFVETSEPFFEDGIKHVNMILQLIALSDADSSDI